MTTRAGRARLLRRIFIPLLALTLLRPAAAQQVRRYLYVAVPGAENDAEYRSAPGILVFDIDDEHKFVRRIPLWAASADGQIESVRGIAADVKSRRLYITTVKRIAAIDLATDKIVWEKSYEGQCCDRLAISPDGATIYAPAFGSPKWYVIRADTGGLVTTISVAGWPRQTIYGSDGRHAYLAAWESKTVLVVDTAAHKVIREVGPFSSFLCPFTVNSRETLAFANVDRLVGFEVGDLRTGLILDRVIVEGYQMEVAPKYECPSHGIAFNRDERELWVADGVDNRLHVFDATVYPPTPTKTIAVRAQPRWISFGVDGRYAYPSTGDVIDAKTKAIVATLEDERRTPVQSEKLLEIDLPR
jgi:DNA-binding beta-propeller fold protein YncE